MTDQDPKLPDPGLGRNPPRYRELDTDSFGTGSFIALIFGIMLISGLIFFGVRGLSTTAANPPPVTTGQGGSQFSPSTVPKTRPAPATTNTLPPIDQNVPAEKIAPPIPTEPRTNN